MTPLRAIFLVALAVRVAVVVATPGFEPVHDALDYQRHAQSIAAGDGYPESVVALEGGDTAFRPPGYPFVLGAVFAVSGDSLTAGRLAGALFGAIAAALAGMLAGRLLGARAGLVAGLLAAVFPPLALLAASLTVEPLFIALALGAILATLAWRDGGGLRYAALAGLLCGLAVLTRFNGLVLLLPLLVGVATAAPATRRTPAAVALCGITLLVMVPWTVRSSTAFDAFVPLGTQGGYALAGTYNDVARGDAEAKAAWRLPNLIPDLQPIFFDRSNDEREIDAELRERALEHVRDHPLYLARSLALNGWRTLNPFAYEVATEGSYDAMGVPEGIQPVLTWSWPALMPFMLAGAAIMLLGRVARPPLFVWLVAPLLLASLAFIVAEARYRTMVDPFAIVAAAALAAPRSGQTAGRASTAA